MKFGARASPIRESTPFQVEGGDMPSLSMEELQEELERYEDLIDEAASILADDKSSDGDKLARLEDLIFSGEAGD
jgi:hypothetical protein